MTFPNMYLTRDMPGHLCQGDIFSRFDDPVLPLTNPEASGFLVLTYTCDLENPDDISFISVCPVFSLNHIRKKLMEQYKVRAPQNLKEAVGNHLHDIAKNKKRFHFFLSPATDFSKTPAYADLAQIFSIPKRYIPTVVGKRICGLKNPWREKLGFMVGYLYNRVATKDIDKNTVLKYAFGASDN